MNKLLNRRTIFISASLLIVLTLAMSFAAATVLRQGSAQHTLSAADQLKAAWQRAREAGSYRFDGDVTQVTAPSASIVNVGRSGRSEKLHLEGQSDIRTSSLQLQLWGQGGSVVQPNTSVGVKVERGQTFTRVGTGDWKADDKLSTNSLAPQGDFMTYLSAMRDVQAQAPETRGGVRFTRYTFGVDGPIFADYMRGQLEAAMRAKGELPVGVALQPSSYYANMTGSGEFWVRDDGLPLRQIMNLYFPARHDESVQSQITINFLEFAPLPSNLPVKLLRGLEQIPAWPTTLFVMTLGLIGLFFRFHTSRRLQRVMSVTLVVAIVCGPLMSAAKMRSFLDAQVAHAATDAEQAKAAATGSVFSPVAFNPHQNPIAAAEARAKVAGMAAGMAMAGMGAVNVSAPAQQTTGGAALLPPSATLWWPGEGNANDILGTKSGTLGGSATYAAGKVGQAFSFNGSNGYVALPDNAFPYPATGTSNDPSTLEFWFKTGTGGVILGQQNTAPYVQPTGGYVPAIYVDTDGKLRVSMFFRGANTTVPSTNSVTDNVFHHVAVVYDGATQSVYLDGTFISSVPHQQTGYASNYKYQFGTGYTLGWAGGNSGWFTFNGLIDEPTFYTWGLSAADVQAIYAAGSAGKSKGLTGDTDGDGLTDYQEARISTDSTFADSDEDSVPDGVEAKGFVFGGKTWYLNPNKIDSNDDGIADGLECWKTPPASTTPTAPPCDLDTDADGTPDVFDNDNDGDGVPDRIDQALFTVGGANYTEASPMKLTLNNLTVGKTTFVDFQLRPKNDKQLWYAFNVLDWPLDNNAQFQDTDNKTYADSFAPTPANPSAPLTDGNGDTKLIPMLEIRISPTATTNLPPQSDLTPYNIAVNAYDTKTKIVYVPLTVQTDEKTGQRVAFTAHMPYLPTGSWPTPHEMRLAWTVQMLNDVPCDPNAADARQVNCVVVPDGDTDTNNDVGYVYNVPQIVQTYYSDWTLTGMSVTEDNCASIATIYEDPAVDTNLKDDAPLWMLSRGLDNSFMGGRDADKNGKLDVNLAEVVRRFDRLGNSGVSNTQRWSIPNTLRVDKRDYPTHDRAVVGTTMTETKRVLNDMFSSKWQADKNIKPLLMFATETKYRRLGLDSNKAANSLVSVSGNAVTFNFPAAGTTNTAGGALNTEVGLKWSPFCGGTAATPVWDACETNVYWKELSQRYPTTLVLPGEPNDPNIGAANVFLLQVYAQNLREGATALVQSGEHVVTTHYELDDDSGTADIVGTALDLGASAIEFVVGEVLTARWEEKIPFKQYLGNNLKALSSSAPVEAIKFINLGAYNRLQGSATIIGGILLVGWHLSNNYLVVFPLKPDLTDLTGPATGLTNDGKPAAGLSCPLLPSQPVLDLRFEELPGATAFADSSGRGVTATITTGAPTVGLPGAKDANGKAAGIPASDFALGFNGSALTANTSATDDFSVAFWMKAKSGFNGNPIIIDQGANLANGWVVWMNNGQLVFTVGAGGGMLTNAHLDDDTWHFVTATRERTSGKVVLFVDGVEANSNTYPKVAMNAVTDLRIGNGRNGARSFVGQLDNVQLYRTALLSDTVKAMYDRTLQSYCVAAQPAADGSAVNWAKVKIYRPDLRGGPIVASGGLTVTIDADSPTIELTSIRTNAYVRGNKTVPQIVTIGGNANDATSGVASVAVRVNNGPAQTALGTHAWTLQLPVTENAYVLNPTVFDRAGNLLNGASATLIADATPPTLQMNRPATNRIVPSRNTAGQWTVAISGQVNDPAVLSSLATSYPGSGVNANSVQVRLADLNGTDVGLNTWQTATVSGNAWSVVYVLPNAIGDSGPTSIYRVSARAADKVGNAIETAFTGGGLSLILDAAVPQATLNRTDVARGVLTNTILSAASVSIGGLVSETGYAGLNKLDVAFAPMTQVLPLSSTVLNLTFDEPAGSLYFVDNSGQINNATCNFEDANHNSCPAAGVPGRKDLAAQFDNDFVTVNRAVTNDFSVAFWIKAKADGNSNAIIVDQGANLNTGWTVWMSQGQLGFLIGPSGLFLSPARINDDTWHHVMVTRDGTAGKSVIYIDGVAVNTNTTFAKGPLNAVTKLRIGSDGSGRRFNGALDDVRLLTRALSAAEVQAIYQSANRTWSAATLTVPGNGVTPEGYDLRNWSLPVPTNLEGLYQIDLRGEDKLGNRAITPNVWRGMIDVVAPRVTLTGTATGNSYLDTNNVRKVEVRYTCRADDWQLNEASFDCAGNSSQTPARSFNTDPILLAQFPSLALLTTLSNTYTVWQNNTQPVGTVRACDTTGKCTTTTLAAVATTQKANSLAAATDAQAEAFAPSATPKGVIIEPAEGSVIALAAGDRVVQVTVAGEASQVLKEMAVYLDDALYSTFNFEQASAMKSAVRTLPMSLTTDGEHVLSVKVTDWAGTASPLAATKFTVISGLPAIELDSSVLTITDTYGVHSNIVILKGTVDTRNLAAVKIRVNNGRWADARFGDGRWEIAMPVADLQGQALKVMLRAVDRLGQVKQHSSGETLLLSEGGNPPDTQITSGPNGTADALSATLSFSGTAGDRQVAAYECQLDNGGYAPCASPHMFSVTSNGEHTLRVRAIDSQGYVDPSPASVSWTVRSTQFETTLTSTPANPSNEGNARFGFEATGASGFECSLDGGEFAACSNPQAYSNLEAGEHVFLVRAKEAAATRFVWTVATIAPTANSQDVNVPTNQIVPITLSGAGGTGGNVLRYKVLSKPSQGVLLGLAPNLSYEADSGYLGEDSFTFKVSVNELDSAIATVKVHVTEATQNGPVLVLYDDARASGWDDWSDKITRTWDSPTPVKVGSKAIRVQGAGTFGTLTLRGERAVDASQYDALSFWVYGGAEGNTLAAFVQSGDDTQASSYVFFTAEANAWKLIHLRLSAFGGVSQIKRVNIQDITGRSDSSYSVDQIVLVQHTDTGNAPEVIVYEDALAASWQSWSYGITPTLGSTAIVQAGTAALAVQVNKAWGTLALRNDVAIDTKAYDAVEFDVYGDGAQKPLAMFVQEGDATQPSNYVFFTPKAGAWMHVKIPLGLFGASTQIKRINIQDASGVPGSRYVVDNLKLTPPTVNTNAVQRDAEGKEFAGLTVMALSARATQAGNALVWRLDSANAKEVKVYSSADGDWAKAKLLTTGSDFGQWLDASAASKATYWLKTTLSDGSEIGIGPVHPEVAIKATTGSQVFLPIIAR